jgi:hypothetical protein
MNISGASPDLIWFQGLNIPHKKGREYSGTPAFSFIA